MNGSVTAALVLNAVLLLAVAQALELMSERVRLRTVAARSWLVGAILGAVAVAVMSVPLPLLPGVIFDVRSVLLAVAGLYFGIVPTAIAMAIAAAWRLMLGGEAAWTGVAVIVASGAIGVVWRHVRTPRLEDMRWTELYALGLFVHLSMLALMFTLPWSKARATWP